MKKLLLDPEGDAERIRRTPAGGFILADKVDSWTELIEAFVKEIRSEAAADQTDAINALPFELDEIRASTTLSHGLQKAMQSSMEERKKDE